MKKAVIILMVLSLVASSATADFLNDQKKFTRVNLSWTEKASILKKNLKQYGLQPENVNILILVFKSEGILEIHAKRNTDSVYQKINSYEICSHSGQLGPKREYGDYQVPEGFYLIERFNPTSSYYMSLGLSYPNKADKIKSHASNLGGDIFIHGSCVTIGCLPMTDDKIKEIYLYAVLAKNNGQKKIPVYVFPYKMTEQNWESISSRYQDKIELLNFWKNLKIGYDKFAMGKKELMITVDKNGDYNF